MNYVDYRFSLDTQGIGSQVFLTVKQGDTNRRLIINLTEGHEPYTIVEGCTAVLAGTKSDGNVIFNNAVIEGNNIIYDFTEQTVAAVGSMKCEVRLYMEGRKLCSPNFTISVLPDAVSDAQIQSLTEVNTLTGLINEATALIEDVNADLESGAFVPKLEIGIVATLPTGANATASITGTGKNPVLNLGLPRGPIGTADGLIVDPELSKNSTNPIQNRPVAEEFETVRAELQGYAEGVAETFAAVEDALGNKVEKAAGKGLSTNDFTNEDKAKLDGIEAGANNFVLGDGAVTRAKLAQDALYSPVFNKTDSFSIVQSEVGGTYFVNASGKDVVVSVSSEMSSSLLPGADFAIFWFAANSITIELNNCRAFVHGDSTQYGRIDKTVNIVINEVNSMTAIKKLYSNPSYGDVWTIIGDVEVTTV